MLRYEASSLGRVFGLLILIVVVERTGPVHSTPLLHPYSQYAFQIDGRAQSVATDGTNVLVSLYSEATSSSGLVFVAPDGSKADGLAHISGKSFLAFNGTNYLVAWVEKRGDFGELNCRFMLRSGTVGSNFVSVSGI